MGWRGDGGVMGEGRGGGGSGLCARWRQRCAFVWMETEALVGVGVHSCCLCSRLGLPDCAASRPAISAGHSTRHTHRSSANTHRRRSRSATATGPATPTEGPAAGRLAGFFRCRPTPADSDRARGRGFTVHSFCLPSRMGIRVTRIGPSASCAPRSALHTTIRAWVWAVLLAQRAWRRSL